MRTVNCLRDLVAVAFLSILARDVVAEHFICTGTVVAGVDLTGFTVLSGLANLDLHYFRQAKAQPAAGQATGRVPQQLIAVVLS